MRWKKKPFSFISTILALDEVLAFGKKPVWKLFKGHLSVCLSRIVNFHLLRIREGRGRARI
jgi:hypothetical protein